ncbi:alpha-2-macroglobulin family protein [Schlesneria sp.]|uniref:alpha-2-macroglobulin family protein n=1 Tax=Schlesneria sp. TaxID=2762018 RepID=UPI002F0D2D33
MSKLTFLLSALSFCVVSWSALAEEAGDPVNRGAVRKEFEAGNFKTAYEGARKLLLDEKSDAAKVGGDLAIAVQSLQNLGRTNEVDELIEAAVKTHASNWRFLADAGRQYGDVLVHDGFLIAGKFERGSHRGGGQYVTAANRDRVRALQLFQQALPLALKDPDHKEVGRLFIDFAQQINRVAPWKLQTLTELAVLPDYEEQSPMRWRGRGPWDESSKGAPVDAEGHPVLHQLPASWEAATTDGERWRWALMQAVEFDKTLQNQVDFSFAQFLHQHFGVQTIAWLQRGSGRSDDVDESGPFAVQSLSDDETIAKLATGVKRFKLPDEFNPIKLFQTIANREQKDSYSPAAADQLAQIYEDRRQYKKAAASWTSAIQKFGAQEHRQPRLDQIVKNWGRFENLTVAPAGRGAVVDFRFRNASEVSFEARVVKIDKLLEDVKRYLKSSPAQLDWSKFNIQDLGYRLVTENQTEYLGESVATWKLDLKPKPDHFDDVVTVTTPLQKAGAYLLTGRLKDGNVSHVIVWLADTVLVRKPLDGKSMHFVADAVTGQPIANANVEFFGWKQTPVDKNQSRWKLTTTNFSEFTDGNGLISLPSKRMPNDHQWMIVARTKEGRLAYTGFTHSWWGQKHDEEYNAKRVYAITDRPVYRPEQTVKFKFWIQTSKYDVADKAEFANREFKVLISNPQGEGVFQKVFTTDHYGGLEGEFPLPKGAMLGTYQLVVQNEFNQGGSFRVEEYKKPEYEVKIDAPTEPIALGEKITATIKAKYFFGAPVTKAKVKYKVQRSAHDSHWYPIANWDWLYGRGYWWFASDYTWYPGWNRWGCVRPKGWWIGHNPAPPELITEQEVEIGEDGEVRVEIDTLAAKEIHGDEDHSYTITAEVVDESRRTIVGTGNVLVARQPFKVFTWVDRGHYRVGDDIHASFQAHTLDNKPVKGTGELTLFRISYDADQKPVETAVQSWKLDTNEQGHAQQQIAASKAGQYRLSYKLTDSKQHSIEGGYVFVVRGDGFDGREFRFNDLELITDKQEYAPGDTVNLMVTTNNPDGCIVLFIRPSNGVYLPPKVIRLKGKTTVEEVAVIQKDMPNFFLEAFTVSNGKYHQETREVVVPPEKRIINVEVQPSATEYQPGADARVHVKLTDPTGEPFVGSTVLTVYDKTVEYISGGSNVPEIKEFFWKWRRNHFPQGDNTLDRSFSNLIKTGDIPMNDLGVFGGLDAGISGDRIVFLSAGRGRAAGGQKMMAAPAGAMMRGAMPMPAAMEADFASTGSVETPDGAVEGAMQTPTIRSNFADTAFWTGSLTTDQSGMAEVSFKMPESLTGWKVKTWAMGLGTKVGQSEVEVTTRKNLLVRLQAPRFFVDKDEVVISANVHSYLKSAKSVEVTLAVDGKLLSLIESNEPNGGENRTWPLKQTISLEPGGEQRVNWRVKVASEGVTEITVSALTDEESDAMKLSFPVYIHGMLKTESFSGAIRPTDSAGQVTFVVPEARRQNESRLEARFSPTLAGAMVDALPYLVEYPYGCTEQTLNRFLPTVITQRLLLKMQLNLKDIQAKRTNLNAQEIGDDVERAKGWKRFDRNPVFDEEEVRSMVKEGLERLTSMQVSDGGWGWFSGYGERSWPHTTAVVVHGLQVAKANDVAIVPGVLERGIEWLTRYQTEQVEKLKNWGKKDVPQKQHADALDAFIYMLLLEADISNSAMDEFLFRDRVQLPVYAKALYGLALHRQQQADKLKVVLENIEQFVVEDEENQTAYLKLPHEGWWYWYGNDIEANAYYLKLLSKTNPNDRRASRLVKYLLNNRKHATYWNSTRDTALCIEALAEYQQASGEDKPNLTVEVWLDGQKQKEVKIDASNLFTFDNKFVLEGDAVTTGKHTLELKKQGTGPLYYNVYQTNFTLEDFISRAGLEVKVDRKFYKLTRVEKKVDQQGARGQAVKQQVEKFERTELPSLSELKSGDLVEVELEIESKNDYEYLLFEDLKAAAFEPVEVRSGYNGNPMGAFVEFRDERVTFFVRQLMRGKHSLSYRLRAETPGQFSALPAKASAMYAPELKGNSDEMKVKIID